MKNALNSLLFIVALFSLFITGAWSCAPIKNNTQSDLFLAGPVVACSHINLYQLSEDNKSYIQVIIDASQLALEQSNKWEISRDNEAVVVKYLEFNVDVSSKLCSDIRTKKIKPLTEHIATTGTINLELSDVDWEKYKHNKRYKIDLKAVGLDLKETNYGLNISQATVGWMPG